MKILKRIFGKRKVDLSDNVPQECPDNWSLTLDDLFQEINEGKRKSIEPQEGAWAKEYERSLIPASIRFPSKGDVYESKQDQIVDFMTAWSRPFTGDGTGTLLKGDSVWVHTDPGEEKPLGTYAIPVDYEKLEKRMVPLEERNDRHYEGFYFYFKTVELNENFILVDTIKNRTFS